MSSYIRSRNRSAFFCLLSLCVFVPALVIPRSGEDLTVRKMILFSSLAALLCSAVWLVVRCDEVRRLTRLRSGKGIVARWTIDPARWEWFRARSMEWDKREGVRPNDINLAQEAGDAGIDVSVTLDAILVGEDFQSLERDVRIAVHADWIEFHQIIPKPKGQPFHVLIRLPLQPGQEGLASEVQQSYQRAYRAAGTGRWILLYIALGLLVGLPAVTTLIWLIARVTGWIN